MSISARKEYLLTMQARYRKAASRQERTRILDEVVATTGFHRKHAIRALNSIQPDSQKVPRKRPRLYTEALPAIALVWEALDYCCAERLHPQLLPMAQRLAGFGAFTMTPQIQSQLGQISRATLARRLREMPSPKPRKLVRRPRPGQLLSGIPIERYAWDEARVGALEIDLVEHNGGSSSGHFAYTLSVVDIVSAWSRRRAILGRSQRAVHGALSFILLDWPTEIWGLHSDNGSEFLNDLITRFAKDRSLVFTRSRPYRKNDNAHVEQRNGQYVRQIVGYARYESQQAVDWLNAVYALLDPYTNLILPTMKVIQKTRVGSKVKKAYDTARSPLQRLIDTHSMDQATQAVLEAQAAAINPLDLRRELDALVARGPLTSPPAPSPNTAPSVVVG